MAFVRRAVKRPYVVKVGTRHMRLGWMGDGLRPRPNTFTWNELVRKPAAQRAYVAKLRRKRLERN